MSVRGAGRQILLCLARARLLGISPFPGFLLHQAIRFLAVALNLTLIFFIISKVVTLLPSTLQMRNKLQQEL